MGLWKLLGGSGGENKFLVEVENWRKLNKRWAAAMILGKLVIESGWPIQNIIWINNEKCIISDGILVLHCDQACCILAKYINRRTTFGVFYVHPEQHGWIIGHCCCGFMQCNTGLVEHSITGTECALVLLSVVWPHSRPPGQVGSCFHKDNWTCSLLLYVQDGWQDEPWGIE